MSLLSTLGNMMASAGDADPYFASRVAVLNLNADLTDAKGKVWTANGNAAVSGGYLNLDGTGDYLSTPESEDFDFATEQFCAEAIVNLAASPGAYVPIIAKWQTGSLSFYFGINTVRRLVLFVRLGVNDYFPEGTSFTIPLNTDTHVAAYRVGSSFYAAVGGSVQSILTSASSVNNTSQATAIGAQSNGSNGLAAKVRGARLTKGSSGGYGASNFTPPSFPLPTS